MRVISSVHEIDAQQTGSLDKGAASALCSLIDKARANPERESYCADQTGQRTFEVVLTSYTAPDGRDLWAVYTSDNMGSAYLDAGDKTEANTRYETEVRELARCADASMYAWWEVTDVPGLRQNSHLYELTVRAGRDEDWEPVEQGQVVLGENRDSDWDYDDLEITARRLVDERFGHDPEGNTEARVTFWTRSRDDEPVTVEIVELVGA